MLQGISQKANKQILYLLFSFLLNNKNERIFVFYWNWVDFVVGDQIQLNTWEMNKTMRSLNEKKNKK